MTPTDPVEALARTVAVEAHAGDPLLLCPECAADRGLPADQVVGVPGVPYRCPVCQVQWEEADDEQRAREALGEEKA